MNINSNTKKASLVLINVLLYVILEALSQRTEILKRSIFNINYFCSVRVP